jgi:hypothetical protein
MNKTVVVTFALAALAVFVLMEIFVQSVPAKSVSGKNGRGKPLEKRSALAQPAPPLRRVPAPEKGLAGEPKPRSLR